MQWKLSWNNRILLSYRMYVDTGLWDIENANTFSELIIAAIVACNVISISASAMWCSLSGKSWGLKIRNIKYPRKGWQYTILCLTLRMTVTSARIPEEGASHHAQFVCFLTRSKRNTGIDTNNMRLAACFIGRTQWRYGRSRDETKYSYN